MSGQVKDSRSLSSIDVDIRYRIPVMLREQQCWEFASSVNKMEKNAGVNFFTVSVCCALRVTSSEGAQRDF